MDDLCQQDALARTDLSTGSFHRKPPVSTLSPDRLKLAAKRSVKVVNRASY
jgi:hypothetical protein